MNDSKSSAPAALAGLLAWTLTACGGGGTSNVAVVPTPAPVVGSFPIQQGLAYAFTHGLQSTLTVTGSTTNGAITYPLTGTLTYSLGAVVNATFDGAAVLQSTEGINGTLFADGRSIPMSTSGQLYVNAQYAPVGSTDTSEYCVASSTAGYPATATAGQTGDIASFNCYADSSKRTLVSTQKITYATTAGSDGNSLNFQMLSNIYDAANRPLGSTATTYAISTAGMPKLARVQVSQVIDGISISVDAK